MKLITWYSNEYQNIADITVPRMMQWAWRYRITCVAFVSEPVLSPPSWNKVPHILDVIKTCNDDVLWLDVDCFIADIDRGPHILTKFASDMVFGSDDNGLCAAAILCRKPSVDILQAMLTLGNIPTAEHQEQATIRHLIPTFPDLAKRLELEPWILDVATPRKNPFVIHGRANGDTQRAVDFINAHRK